VGQTPSPVTLILAGLVVSLYCGALNRTNGYFPSSTAAKRMFL
jgi:hypothetical protein